MRLIDERPAAPDTLGIPAHENADEVLLLRDALFEVRDGGPRAEHELLGLPDVEHGRRATVREQLRQAQRVLSGRERPARDLQLEILLAQLEIGDRDVADEGTDDLTLGPFLRKEAGA